MGASLMKLTPAGREEKKTRLIQKYYNEHCKDIDSNKPNEFYQAVCKTVEEINRKFGYTQIHIPETDELERLFNAHVKPGETLSPEGFHEILRYLVFKAGFTNAGALDSFFYILIAPGTALLIKNAVNPKAISNQFLVPGVTSATVLLLALLKKI
ncbi:hypothetical protein PVL29_010719 [Vitis rotundifolia]|uniref:Uncharacterized protein n=1 Tax=Vitis rotundifolia TaxID=103349 RepID=A0AA38ZUD5_VITRO|nr:hypothetical protein PVL29_010719 [Vitis rotundifolia]